MTQTSILNCRRYRSAVAINNIGVRLLERKCYGPAVESFVNAAELMKIIILQNDTAPFSSSRIQAHEGGEDQAHRSMVSLGTTEPAKDAVLHLETLMATIDGAIVSGEMPEALPSHCVTSVMTQAPSSSVAFPFRIEDNLLLEDGLQKKNMIVQAAMVWNNLGVACICQSLVDKTNRRTLRRASLHYLKMSFTALESNFGERIMSEDAMTLAGSRTRSMPCLMVAVLNTLLHAYHNSKQIEKARKLYDNLVELRAVAQTLDDSHATVVSYSRAGVVQGAPAA
jgi:hypothetical protein